MKKNFSNLDFNGFKKLATDKNLSKYEKIGFPNSYREGYEDLIFNDILRKLDNLNKTNSTIIDIGPGCSDLPNIIISYCLSKRSTIHLIDNQEMLDQLPDNNSIFKHNFPFPECDDLISKMNESVDTIICYSVFQYILNDCSFIKFIDSSLKLLAPGGQMLIGDIPNTSKRKRFFSSENGIKFHEKFSNSKTKPVVKFNSIESSQIDDSIIFAIIGRARLQGFDAYIVPQSSDLPMANRREDILIIKP